MHLSERANITILMMRGYGDILDLMKQWLLYLTIHFLIVCQLQSLLFSKLSLDLNKQVQLKNMLRTGRSKTASNDNN